MRMSTQARTGTGGFRHLSPISPSAHLSAQKMSQTNSVSTCVSFTRCTGARVHGPDRTRRVRSCWVLGGEELQRIWMIWQHPHVPTLPLASTRLTPPLGASTRQRKRQKPRSGATPPPPVEHRRSDFEEPVRMQFSTNRSSWEMRNSSRESFEKAAVKNEQLRTCVLSKVKSC